MNQDKTTTVYYMRNLMGNIRLGRPNVRTFSQPMDLIRLDREWVKEAAIGMKEDETRYFIIDPNDDTKGILIDVDHAVDHTVKYMSHRQTRNG